LSTTVCCAKNAHHSWNSNPIFFNWIVFHLQRHSDHHAHPLRRYQSLRHFENLPELPNGYVGMFLLCYIPPLWFYLMDPRVVAQSQCDVMRINFQPGRPEYLMHKFGMLEFDSKK